MQTVNKFSAAIEDDYVHRLLKQIFYLVLNDDNTSDMHASP